MRQALHILGKDVRYLGREVALFFALCGLFVWAELNIPIAYVLEVLLLLGMIHVISRVIHAEPLTGDREFWLTRPYRRRSLLMAKFLFIGVFLIVPMGIARLMVLWQLGYPVAAHFPALIFWQLLMLAGVAIPLAAIATLTPGAVQFALAMFGVAVTAVLGFLMLPAVLRQRWDLHAPVWPAGLAWIQTSLLLIVVAATGAVVFWRQYRDRRSGLNRLLAAGGAVLGAVVFFAFPVPAGLVVQAWFSHQAAPAVRVSAVRSPRGIVAAKGADSDWAVPLTLRVRGLPAGTDLQADFEKVEMNWEGGQAFRKTAVPFSDPAANGDALVHALLYVDGATLRWNMKRRLSMRGTVSLTLLGDPQSRTVPVGGQPVNIQDGLQCFSGAFHAYNCRAYFGWPSRLVLSREAGGESSLMRVISYSPVPAGLGLDSQDLRHTTLAEGTREATLVTKRPLTHFSREFEAIGVRLEDLVAR